MSLHRARGLSMRPSRNERRARARESRLELRRFTRHEN